MDFTHELSNRDRIFKSIYKRAVDAFNEDDFEESEERLCHLLLGYADLGDWHKGGMPPHPLTRQQRLLIIGTPNKPSIFTRTCSLSAPKAPPLASPPSDNWRTARDKLLVLARGNLEQAEKDEAKLQADYEAQFDRFRETHDRESTNEELAMASLDRHSSAYLDAIDASDEQWETHLAGHEGDIDDIDGADQDKEGDKHAGDHGDEGDGDEMMSEQSGSDELPRSDEDIGEPLPELTKINPNFFIPSPEPSLRPGSSTFTPVKGGRGQE